MKTIGKVEIAAMLDVLEGDLDTYIASNQGLSHLEYRIDGKIYRLITSAKDFVQSLLALHPEDQKKIVRGLAENVPNFGDSVNVEGYGRNQVGILIRTRAVTLVEDGVIGLVLAR